MLDIAVAYNRYRFLGNEFLTWLWFVIENEMESLVSCDAELVDLSVGNRMMLENRMANSKESLIIKGDAAGLEEAVLALNKGALITEMQLLYKSGHMQWTFGIKGESLGMTGIKLPETAPITAETDMEGAILEKLYLYERPIAFMDQVFFLFIQKRLSADWSATVLAAMKRWLQSQHSNPIDGQ